jgi:hypothetical protein
MSLEDLLVVVDSTAGAALRLCSAADLAHRHGSRLTALYVRELTQAQLAERGTAELGLVSAEELDRLNRRYRPAGVVCSARSVPGNTRPPYRRCLEFTVPPRGRSTTRCH